MRKQSEILGFYKKFVSGWETLSGRNYMSSATRLGVDDSYSTEIEQKTVTEYALLAGEMTGSGRNYVDPETRLGAWIIATPPKSSETISQNISYMALLGGETTGSCRDCMG